MQINVIEYFTKTVKLHPDKYAVIEGNQKITFQDLQRRSVAIASNIVSRSDICNCPIAVYLPKSINTVIADMSITYSGNTYMNLDVKAPLERIFNILKQVEPAFVITDSRHMELIKSILPVSVKVCLIDNIYTFRAEDEACLLTRLSHLIDTDPYCIINTSGSTGTPKSVVLNHKSFIDFTEWSTETLEITNNEIIGSLSPSVFDIYSHELCMMMSKSSTIVLLPEHLSAFPVKILEILKKEEVSYIFWVPTIMVNIANMDLLSKIELFHLKTVWFAGEVFPTKQYNYWHRNLPETKFVNLYGPIEITLDCTYFIVNREFEDGEPLPIGFPCRNTSILILNENNEPCKQGEEGELCVRGTSLAMGYYNNSEKTAAAFVQNPLNSKYPEIIYRTGDIVAINERGEIMFKGRRDTLVKHLGYRIELGEIEHVVVNTLHLVSNGCVVYNHSIKEIILIYEGREDIPAAKFRQQIGQNLPKYMIPTKYIRLDEMPMNANGKIDRLKLQNQINE
ncbi:MAG: amino acid adenylation domain-containing protein [Prevotellaceae bacterium]|jgi:amino acid adenylation domain-containing protein|nr:amino acid adenylation domain-containing protein [Prevotellaceae bacterium]